MLTLLQCIARSVSKRLNERIHQQMKNVTVKSSWISSINSTEHICNGTSYIPRAMSGYNISYSLNLQLIFNALLLCFLKSRCNIFFQSCTHAVSCQNCHLIINSCKSLITCISICSFHSSLAPHFWQHCFSKSQFCGLLIWSPDTFDGHKYEPY